MTQRFSTIVVATILALVAMPASAHARHHHRALQISMPSEQSVQSPFDEIMRLLGVGTRVAAQPVAAIRAPVHGARALVRGVPRGASGVVRATWYGAEMCRRGRSCRTANGEAFRPDGPCVIAHNGLPFGTRVLATGSRGSEVCTVKDRGHAWDFSHGAAMRIGIRNGVRVSVLR